MDGCGTVCIELAIQGITSTWPQLLVGVEGVQVLALARTMKSGAQPVAEALDQLEWPDIAGTIAGDDTVLIICRSVPGRERVVKRLKGYLRG